MFIATTPTPKTNIVKEEAIKDFLHLIGRSCEYIKELENSGRIKAGSFMPLYEKMSEISKNAIEENWN